MAENKKGFLLYADYEELFDELEDVIAGKLIKHILKYVNDKQPTTENLVVNVAFIPIKRQLKRDLEKYEGKREQWSDAGKKSAEVRRLKKEQALTELTNVETVATELTVNVNDNVNVNDINKDIDFKIPSLEYCIELFKTKTAFNWTEDYAIKSANTFYYFYESKNWMVGKNKMKSLNAAIGGWISRDTKPELSTTKTQEQINKEKLDYFKTQGFQI
jgi:hypothetical protein